MDELAKQTMNRTFKTSAVRVCRSGRAAVAEMKGTTHQFYEDRYRLLSSEIDLVKSASRGEIFAVFDGVSGATRGMAAAQAMADALLKFFEEPQAYAPDTEGLARLIQTANVDVNDWGTMPGSDRPLGAAAGTIVWVHNGEATLFHAGDTEAWLLQSGACTCVADSSRDGKVLVDYFGQGKNLAMKIRTFPFVRGNRLLLFTDGVTKVLNQPTIEGALRSTGLIDRAVRALVEAAERLRAPDDVTALMIEG